jgi:hypothetical protein
MVALRTLLKGSTLLETIVAMVIITICSGIGFDLFSDISRNINDELRIEAEMRIGSLAAQTKFRKDYTNSTFEMEDMKLERTFSRYLDRKRIMILMIQAYSPGGKKICEYREIVEINPKNRL